MALRRIRWSAAAVRDPADIRSFTSETRGTRSAAEIVARLRRTTTVLRDTPRIGQREPADGTRRLTFVYPFVLIYRVAGDSGEPGDRLGDIDIVRIWHGAQDRGSDRTLPE